MNPTPTSARLSHAVFSQDIWLCLWGYLAISGDICGVTAGTGLCSGHLVCGEEGGGGQDGPQTARPSSVSGWRQPVPEPRQLACSLVFLWGILDIFPPPHTLKQLFLPLRIPDGAGP